jgi:protocatechuate 3,4-dioxygenase beta subunit
VKSIAILAVLAMVLAKDASAQGRATLNGTVIGPTGAPQPNITLVLTNAEGIDRRAVSDTSGAFVFGGLQPGTYRLRTDDQTFAPFSQDQIVLAGGQTLALRVALQSRLPVAAPPTQRATIQGTVIGPEGRPVPNSTVIITNAEGVDRRAVSDANGAYVFGGLLPGPYRLRIEEPGPGVRPFSISDLTLAPGERRQLDIRLQPVPPPPAQAAPAPQRPAPTPPRVTGVDTAAPQRRGETPPVPEVTAPGVEFEAMPNRWVFRYPVYERYAPAQRMPWIAGGPFDPYNTNTAKGDRPIGGNSLFANVNLQLNSTVNPRQVGAGESATTQQFFYNNNVVAGLEIFRGDTVFQPKSWAIRGTVVGNLNGLQVGLTSVRGNTYGVEEAFVEKRLAVMGPRFDFMSVRGGMQNFNSDFRGYLFADNQLGVRLFGNAGGNRSQYNFAYFSMRERDATSQLHKFSSREQQVFIANYYIQDFGAHGYTGMFNVHINRDSRVSAAPAAGQVGALQVTYVGFHGDGKWGAWSVSHAFYQAFGKDDDNAIARRLAGGSAAPVTIAAQMAAIELSKDADWIRYRLSGYYASGDDGSDPSKASGFDTISDNPNLAGGQFMFWTQQKTAAATGAAPLLVSEKFSLLPNLRSKFADRANFINPGLMLANGGIDLRLSPRLKVVTNVSYLRFADAAILRQLAGPGRGFEDETIGLDLSVGAKYRPFVNENLFLVLGYSSLMPQGGMAASLGSSSRLYSFVGALQLAY